MDVFVIEMLVVMISSLRLAHADSKFLGVFTYILNHALTIVAMHVPLAWLCMNNVIVHKCEVLLQS